MPDGGGLRLQQGLVFLFHRKPRGQLLVGMQQELVLEEGDVGALLRRVIRLENLLLGQLRQFVNRAADFVRLFQGEWCVIRSRVIHIQSVTMSLVSQSFGKRNLFFTICQSV